MSAFTATYILVVVVLVFVEGLAIGRRHTPSTISAHIWAVRASGLLVWPLCVLWVWLTGHLMFPWEPDGTYANDLVYVVVGVAVAYVNVVAIEKKRKARR